MNNLIFTQELKDQWIAALKSGDYIQGKNYLKHPDSEGVIRHCCLGVLAEIHPDMTIDIESDDVIMNERNCSYSPFGGLFEPVKVSWDELAKLNDISNDYGAVIELIEKIPVNV